METTAENNSAIKVNPESTTTITITRKEEEEICNNTTNKTTTTTNNVDTVPSKPVRGGEAWGIDFSLPKMKRKTTKKERDAIVSSRLRRLIEEKEKKEKEGKENEENENETVGVNKEPQEKSTGANTRPLPIVCVDAMADRRCLIPTQLPTTRADLEKRFCLRIPRLLAVTKQYPRSCGVSSLTSIWNYLYSRIGEANTNNINNININSDNNNNNNNNNITGIYNDRPPISQEEVMSILGFEPPFDAISWGPFTGNGTLLRWFHALNRHFGVRGRAYVLYKPQGKGCTSCTSEEALQELKSLLRNPNAAVIYHCHNHYMVPVGYQEIPLAQTDFYAKDVPVEDTETTIYIGEVSRGRHEAMYARKWSEIVKDLMCRSPNFYNIRRPELGIQKRGAKTNKKNSVGIDNDACNKLRDSKLQQQQQEEKEEKQKEENKQEKEGVSPSVLEQSSSPIGIGETTAVAAGVSSQVSPTTVDCVEDNEITKGENAKKTKKKSSGGNLHCLICFRCDQVEEHPERFENVSSSSSSNSSNSSSSDESEADNVE